MSTKVLMSVEEFMRLPDDGMRHELNEGVLAAMPPPPIIHSRIAARIYSSLLKFAESEGAGQALFEAGFRLKPDVVRRPDIAVVRADRIAATGAHEYIEGAPDLAVEVASPANSPEDLEEKVAQYLAHGARYVWVVYPRTRRVHVYEREAPTVRIVECGESLTAPDLLPGLEVPVEKIFSL
jgi:Uma2 family endonuclease